jgi:23S rRNA (adenine2503-C2)-methyltransferase
MPHLYALSRSQVAALVAEWGFSAVHAQRLWRYLYRDLVETVGQMTQLPARMRERLSHETSIAQLDLVELVHSNDALARKYLFKLADGAVIETALMKLRDRMTVCLSSQAGCALGCVFCATGQAGFTRNLTAGEIVAQAVFVQRRLRSEVDNEADESQSRRPGHQSQVTLRNAVMMGMGEPLLNYDAMTGALDILRDSGGLAIGSKQITISTVGVVPGIIRLADEHRPYSLAVSLHAATQDERAALVPAANTWPLDVLLDACRYYTCKLDRRIFIEWTLIEGTNDSVDQAKQLAELLRNIPSQINLIPLNRTTGYTGESTTVMAVDRFHRALRDEGMSVSVRQRRGIDIAGGCGQLAGREQRECATIVDSVAIAT